MLNCCVKNRFGYLVRLSSSSASGVLMSVSAIYCCGVKSFSFSRHHCRQESQLIIDRSQIIIKKGNKTICSNLSCFWWCLWIYVIHLVLPGGFWSPFHVLVTAFFFLLSIRPFMRITLLLVQFPNKKSLKS